MPGGRKNDEMGKDAGAGKRMLVMEKGCWGQGKDNRDRGMILGRKNRCQAWLKDAGMEKGCEDGKGCKDGERMQGWGKDDGVGKNHHLQAKAEHEMLEQRALRVIWK